MGKRAVNVQGLGKIFFPDHMPEDDIAKEVKRLSLTANPVAQGGRDIDPRFTNPIGGSGVRKGLIDTMSNMNKGSEYSLQDFEGRPYIITQSDRSAAGGQLVSIHGQPIDPVDLRGGRDYPFDKPSFGQAWASDPDVVRSLLSRASELKSKYGQEPLLLPYSMAPTGMDFATMPLDAMINFARARMSKANIKKLDSKIKKIIPDWKGVDDPSSNEIFRDVVGDKRKAVANLIDKDFRDVNGGISMAEARVVTADPAQYKVDDGSLKNIALIDSTKEMIPDSGHPTYIGGVSGEGVGTLNTDINARALMEGKGRDLTGTSSDIRALSMNPSLSTGVIDNELLKNVYGFADPKLLGGMGLTGLGLGTGAYLWPQDSEAGGFKTIEELRKLGRLPKNPEGGRIFKTEDGYTFYEQPDGTVTDDPDPLNADMTYTNYAELKSGMDDGVWEVGDEMAAKRASDRFNNYMGEQKRHSSEIEDYLNSDEAKYNQAIKKQKADRGIVPSQKSIAPQGEVIDGSNVFDGAGVVRTPEAPMTAEEVSKKYYEATPEDIEDGEYDVTDTPYDAYFARYPDGAMYTTDSDRWYMMPNGEFSLHPMPEFNVDNDPTITMDVIADELYGHDFTINKKDANGDFQTFHASGSEFDSGGGWVASVDGEGLSGKLREAIADSRRSRMKGIDGSRMYDSVDVETDSVGRLSLSEKNNPDINLTTDPQSDRYMGAYLEVLDDVEKVGGKGTATRLYLKALKEAQDRGKGWQSDSMLSDSSYKMYERLKGMGIPFKQSDTGNKYTIEPADLAALDIDSLQQPLPSDTASRMARAKEQGFSDKNFTHLSPRSDITEFIEPDGTLTTSPDALGIWMAEDKMLSNKILDRRHEELMMSGDFDDQLYDADGEFIDDNFPPKGFDPTTYQLKHNIKNPKVFATRREMEGMSAGRPIDEVKRELIKEGYDGVKILDDYGHGTSWVAFKPNQARSIYADFNPANKGKPDLLGGAGALGVGLGLSGTSDDTYASPRSKIMDVGNGKKIKVNYPEGTPESDVDRAFDLRMNESTHYLDDYNLQLDNAIGSSYGTEGLSKGRRINPANAVAASAYLNNDWSKEGLREISDKELLPMMANWAGNRVGAIGEGLRGGAVNMISDSRVLGGTLPHQDLSKMDEVGGMTGDLMTRLADYYNELKYGDTELSNEASETGKALGREYNELPEWIKKGIEFQGNYLSILGDGLEVVGDAVVGAADYVSPRTGKVAENYLDLML